MSSDTSDASKEEEDRRTLVLALIKSEEQMLTAFDLTELSCMTEKLSSLTPGECGMVTIVMDLLRGVKFCGEG